MIKNKHLWLPKYLRFNNGKELVNEELKRWSAGKGIIIETTAPYSPSQNGVAKRFNCMLLELAHAMLFEKNSFGMRQWHMQHIYVTEHQHEPLMGWHHSKPGLGRNLAWDTYANWLQRLGSWWIFNPITILQSMYPSQTGTSTFPPGGQK